MSLLPFILIAMILVLLLLLYIQRQKTLKLTSLYQAQTDYLDLITERIIIMHFSLEGEIQKVSNAYENIFGYSKNDLLGQSIDKKHMSPTRSDKSVWEILESEGHFEGEMELFSTEGKSYWMYKQIVKNLDAQGYHCGYIAISHDITAVKAYEEQQSYLINQSRHATMGEMISMIGHQWKQPLATIAAIVGKVQLEMELDQFSEEELREDTKKIENILRHLSQTVEDFHQFFKTDKNSTQTNLYTLVHDAIALVNFKFKNIELLVEIREDFTLMVLKNELLQVIINFVSNAADALNEIENIEDATITIRLIEEEDVVIIEISDNAVGIKEEILPYIFDPYFSTKSKNGTGLGLYICKTIVEKHLDGKIEVANQERGCSFSIVLPTNLPKIES